MEYNMSFQAAALAVMLLILYDFMKQRLLLNASTKFFLGFVSLGVLDVIFDMITTPLLVRPAGNFAAGAKLLLTVFYLLQVTVPYLLLAYAQMLRNTSKERIMRSMLLWLILPAAMAVLVVFNYKLGLMFAFSEDGVYRKGPGYLLMYLYAFLMAGFAALSGALHYRELGARKYRIIWEFLLLEAICTGIQAWDGRQLMTSFGLGLGVVVLYLTLNNPSGYLDNMTGLYDKQYFDGWIGDEVARKRPIYLLAADCYQVKQVNMVYGSSTGDQLLLQAADGLRRISGSRKIFRVTGNRFILIVDSLAEYEQDRKQLERFFSQTFSVGDEKIAFPAVICGIINAEEMQKEDTLLAYIEYMVALAKRSDATAVIQSDARILEGFRYEQEAEHFLKTAIEQDLFEVYYQPVYSLELNSYVTLEALTRLRHPTLGMIPPDVIFSIAEKRGLISEIGLLQFKKICRFLKEHGEIMKTIRNVKFNLSPSELLKPWYCDALVGMIHESGLPASYFQFEVTETVATQCNENLWQAIRKFQDTGIGLCLDDFGSGYANLDMVLRLPFSAVKMDRSLLSEICTDAQSAVFYQSIVLMMQNMGYKVISEGVEEEREVALLRQWGVDMIQGFYFSKPLPESEVLRVVG